MILVMYRLNYCFGKSPAKVAELISAHLVVCFAILFLGSCSKSIVDDSNEWRVFAIEYGQSDFSRSALIQNGDKTERQAFSWYAWLIIGHQKRILIDTGFGDKETANKWKIKNFKPVNEIIKEAGISSESITDVVLTHLHWDHAGNIKPYQNARIHINSEEWNWAKSRVNEKQPERSGVRHSDLKQIELYRQKNQVHMLSNETEIFPGISTKVGGAHTGGIMWLTVKTNNHIVVLASDNAFLYENLETLTPIGQTASPDADLAVLTRITESATHSRLIVPGHDPLVAKKFTVVAPHMFEIR